MLLTLYPLHTAGVYNTRERERESEHQKFKVLSLYFAIVLFSSYLKRLFRTSIDRTSCH